MTSPTPDTSQDIHSNSYAHAFIRLEQIAQQLSQHTLTDIDQLLTLVDEGLLHYQTCQNRIHAVEALLAEKLKQIN